VLASLGGGLTIVAAKYQPVIRPNTMVGPVAVGGLTIEEAQKKVRIWWETEKLKQLTLTCPEFKKPLPPMTASQLGITVDDVKSVGPCEVNDFWDAASQEISGKPARSALGIVYKSNGAKADELEKVIKSAIGPARPAKVSFTSGVVTRTPEVTSYQLDETKLSDAVTSALQADGEVQVPVTEAPKHVPDVALNKITDVVSSYSSHFPAYQTSRNTNIRLASEKLSGHILMPGERISFNQTVGQRTVRGGFRTAPVLKNGKHDEGIGGGICQVSGTLYNAVLLADLKIINRHNHSTPSVYVPVGRDATVDWPDLDFVFENPGPDPVAIWSTYESGRLTWRVLGKKDPSKVVKIETYGLSVGEGRTQRVLDPSLPLGKQKILERGGPRRTISARRVVYKDGVVVKRESLGTSFYSGLITVVAVGTKKPTILAPKPTGPAATVPTTQPTPAPAPGIDNDGG